MQKSSTNSNHRRVTPCPTILIISLEIVWTSSFKHILRLYTATVLNYISFCLEQVKLTRNIDSQTEERMNRQSDSYIPPKILCAGV